MIFLFIKDFYLQIIVKTEGFRVLIHQNND